MPHQVSISLYNSAGELVKVLFNGGAQYLPGDLQLSEDVVPGGAGSLVIRFPGTLYDPALGAITSVTWGADNNSGQLVKSGIYTIKAQITDQFGSVTTLQHSVQVLAVTAQNSLDIYNSAGELVTQLSLPSTGRFSALSLASDSYGVKYDDHSGVIASSSLFALTVTDEHGVPSTVYWDGRNAQGLPVVSGSYIAELVYGIPGGGNRVVESKSFVVLQAGDSAGLAGSYAAPNPVQHGADLVLHYPVSAQYRCVARLYSLSGELIAYAEDPGQLGELRINTGAIASGVFFAQLEKLSGGAVAGRMALKVAVVR
jgi:hypothetical protein